MSLKTVFESQPDRRYIMFGGKGGLGKTTLSATSAFWLASQGKRVLLFSVDPQASLSDIFQRDIFGKGPVPIMQNLWAQEVNADQRIRDYQEEIRKKILDMYGFDRVPEEIDNYIAAASAEPAMEESAIFDAVVDIIVQGDYDYYIYDLVTTSRWPRSTTSGSTRSPSSARTWASTIRWRRPCVARTRSRRTRSWAS
ncbi:MAG: hypothetical protein DME04_00280 [Candidatus Rokuibacteriota bacterium]|nr:MAG: hypothetical protein DME04_00280 [Candidatus Rokubacteria bacterium]